ncbi:MAG: carotene hydroxylase [Flavobacterium sp. MedPE-SWcel]|uniref:sterol desaturase family protein n=1 Tax=uncultured Flavobacterium sp. TaxID=165435 RepID=UPI00091AD14F|nr:sterol desaturase family protein [uncultured Flavobacterium sp.]OIQ21097.1 MAG: carotene hydroxylase [Flavobacterium sp. MedPE-SWcel]
MILVFIFTTIATFLTMEGITWLTHKYVMHGFLWYLHKDHHQPKYKGLFEKNDAFFVIFAIPSILLFYFGLEPILNFKFFIGLGILIYGIAYFLVHDVLIHQRFSWFKRTNNKYLKGLRKAHKIHHKHLGKEDGECFGMLNVPKKYFINYRK